MNKPAKPASQDTKPPSPERYRTLPTPTRLEDTIATHQATPPPDPTMGHDCERDFLLRNTPG